MHASKQSGCHPLEKDGNCQCTEESYRTVSEQGCQLSHIAHETHAFQTKLTLTRIAPFFSYITHGMRRAMHRSLHSRCWIATRFAKDRNYSCTARKNVANGFLVTYFRHCRLQLWHMTILYFTNIFVAFGVPWCVSGLTKRIIWLSTQHVLCISYHCHSYCTRFSLIFSLRGWNLWCVCVCVCVLCM